MDEKFKEYYYSAEWQNTKARARDFFSGCIFTGSQIYDLHHLNYFNLKNEKFWLDVVPLRTDIHEDFHSWAKESGKKYYSILEYAESKKLRITEEVRAELEKSERYNSEVFVKVNSFIEKRKKKKLKKASSIKIKYKGKDPKIEIKIIKSALTHILLTSKNHKLSKINAIKNQLLRFLGKDECDKFCAQFNDSIKVSIFVARYYELIKKLEYDTTCLHGVCTKVNRYKKNLRNLA